MSSKMGGKILEFWKERLGDLCSEYYVSEELVACCERATNGIEKALWEKKKK